jgi:type I pantothenate kinase
MRADLAIPVSEAELAALRGVNVPVLLDEVADIYLPLARLLSLYYSASQGLFTATAKFLGHTTPRIPYTIGLAGSVAVGKSTTGRIIRELLARMPAHPRVDLVSTDGFLLPNRVLKDRGLMERKGFPESFDVNALVRFLYALKSGERDLPVPVYSHLVYDIVPGKYLNIDQPDIVVVEGLNILQTANTSPNPHARTFVSDFFDFSIYVDADEHDIFSWYENRLLTFRRSAFTDPASYFHKYSKLSEDETRAFAAEIWRNINGRNLAENIAPTRERADLILHKGADHAVDYVRLRKI